MVRLVMLIDYNSLYLYSFVLYNAIRYTVLCFHDLSGPGQFLQIPTLQEPVLVVT